MSLVLNTARNARRILCSPACAASSTPYFLLEVTSVCVFVVSVFTLPSSLRTESYGSLIPWLRHVLHSLIAGTSLALATVSTYMAISRELHIIVEWFRQLFRWRAPSTVEAKNAEEVASDFQRFWRATAAWTRLTLAIIFGLAFINVGFPALAILLGALGRSIPGVNWLMSSALRVPVEAAGQFQQSIGALSLRKDWGFRAAMKLALESLGSSIMRQAEVYYPERSVRAIGILSAGAVHLATIVKHVCAGLSPVFAWLGQVIPEVLSIVFFYQERLLPLKPHFFTLHGWAARQIYAILSATGQVLATLPAEMAEAFIFTSLLAIPAVAFSIQKPVCEFRRYFETRNACLILAFGLATYMSAFWVTEVLILGVVRVLYLSQGHTIFFGDIYEILPLIPHPHTHFRALQLFATVTGVSACFVSLAVLPERSQRCKPIDGAAGWRRAGITEADESDIDDIQNCCSSPAHSSISAGLDTSPHSRTCSPECRTSPIHCETIQEHDMMSSDDEHEEGQSRSSVYQSQEPTETPEVQAMRECCEHDDARPFDMIRAPQIMAPVTPSASDDSEGEEPSSPIERTSKMCSRQNSRRTPQAEAMGALSTRGRCDRPLPDFDFGQRMRAFHQSETEHEATRGLFSQGAERSEVVPRRELTIPNARSLPGDEEVCGFRRKTIAVGRISSSSGDTCSQQENDSKRRRNSMRECERAIGTLKSVKAMVDNSSKKRLLPTQY